MEKRAKRDRTERNLGQLLEREAWWTIKIILKSENINCVDLNFLKRIKLPHQVVQILTGHSCLKKRFSIE